MKYKLIMLDGFCAGQAYDFHEAPPEFKILKPIKISQGKFCEECLTPETPEAIIYKRTFVPESGRVVLYTINGESETILNNRDWIQTPLQAMIQKPKPIAFIKGEYDISEDN